MEKRDKSLFRRILLRRTAKYTGAGLVAGALVGGLYGDRMHFIWALCAAGALFIAWGWFSYLAADPTSPVHRMPCRRGKGGWPGKRNRVPYALRKDKKTHQAKPAFLRGNEDFDDDLVSATAVDEERLSDKERAKLAVLARAAAGALLLILSFILS